MVTTESDVVIAGGGFAGVSTAVGLAELGLSVTLLERNDEIAEIGAGVNMAPNAGRALATLGVIDEVMAVGSLPKDMVWRDATDGRVLARQSMSVGFEQRYGRRGVNVHRGALLGILSRRAAALGVTFLTNSGVEHVDTTTDGATAVTTNGDNHRGNIVVAADGVHSVLRTQVSDDPLVVEGYVAYRGTIRAGDIAMPVDPDATTIFVAPDSHITQYPVDSPASAEDLTFSHACVFRSELYRQGAATWGTPEELVLATHDWIPGLRAIIDALPKERHWVMYDREPIANWIDGRMVLVGDAAHPMLQYAGQGAAQALEDAVALTAAVREHVVEQRDRDGWEPALKAFNDQRAPRAARVQTYARQAGDIMHVAGIARQLRDARYQHSDVWDFRSLEGLEWLYDL